jgi:hypothetical protein
VTYSAIKSHVNTATVCVFPSLPRLCLSLDRSYGTTKVDSGNNGWATAVMTMDKWIFSPKKEHKLYATKINELLHDSILQQELPEKSNSKIQY